MDNAQIDILKLLQQALGSGIVDALFGVVFDQTRQRLVVLLEFSMDNELNQGKSVDGDAQQICQTSSLVVVVDRKRD